MLLLCLCTPVGCKATSTLLAITFDCLCWLCMLPSAEPGLGFLIEGTQKTESAIFVVLLLVQAFVVF